MTRTGMALCVCAVLAAVVGAALAQAPEDAVVSPTAPNAVALKKAIEDHYAAKIRGLLAPSFTRAPAVSVEVTLDLDAVRKVIETTKDGSRSTETVLHTPGAVKTRSIAVAVPAEELPVGFGLSNWRTLIEKGVALQATDHLELVAMPFQPKPSAVAASRQPAATGAPLSGAARDLLWAATALLLGLMLWNVGRRFAAREPAPSRMAGPAGVAIPAEFIEQARPAPATPAVSEAGAAGRVERPKPRRMADPVSAVRRAADRDPARVAEALRGWVQQ